MTPLKHIVKIKRTLLDLLLTQTYSEGTIIYREYSNYRDITSAIE